MKLFHKSVTALFFLSHFSILFAEHFGDNLAVIDCASWVLISPLKTGLHNCQYIFKSYVELFTKILG